MPESLTLDQLHMLFLGIKGVVIIWCTVTAGLMYIAKAPWMYRSLGSLLLSIIYQLIALALSEDAIAPAEMSVLNVKTYIYSTALLWFGYNLCFLALDTFLKRRGNISSLSKLSNAIQQEAGSEKRIQPRKLQTNTSPVDKEAEQPFSGIPGFDNLSEAFDFNILSPLETEEAPE